MTHDPDSLLVVLDGAGVEPDNVDAALLVRLASSVVEVLDKILKAQGSGGVMLTSIDVIHKCAALKFGIGDADAVACGVREMQEILSGRTVPPPKSGTAVRRLRKLAGRVPEGQSANVSMGETSVPLSVATNTRLPARASLGFRCKLIDAGGHEPRLIVESRFQRSIIIDATHDQAAELGSLLYKHLDIRIQARFDQQYKIDRGKLVSWVLVDAERDPETELKALAPLFLDGVENP